MAIKYWGKTISDYSAMRGPCPEGFHMGDRDEREALVAAWATLWAYTRTGTSLAETYAFRYYFKVARWDYIDANRNDIVTADRTALLAYHVPQTRSYQTSWINEWLQVAITWSWWYMLTSCDWSGSTWTNTARVIRPFKDTPAIPGSTRTMTYDWSSIATWAWIFWNATLWLISVSIDWENWITIADKDLWATNTYSQNNWSIQVDAIWKVFQRWNNYPFPTRWVTLNTSSTQVDASWYWPWNYYYSDTLIIWNRNRETSNNRNLRWWVTWVKQKPVDIVERYYWGKLINDYSAMRGPCPKGYHVPKSSERSAVVNAWVSLWARTTSWTTSVTNFRTYLKLPNIVYLFPGNWLPWTWWTPQHRYYWWCRQTWSDWSWRYCDALDVVEDYWWSIKVDNTSSNHWCPVRPFKDKPVVPDSNWTVLYDWSSVATWAWIFYNATLWLISISSDWTTWTTIADKNAWATNVYNFWDTITSANWWWLYQWWNNYPFSIDWATTTSSTRVDTTWYGPWNYYSGSTFITGGANDDWFSPRNRDLWWWITWIQQKPVKVIEVYYGSTKIRPSYPAWIYWNPNIDWWVISISSNWTDWLTLADKNLWATTVYNLWDTMSEANCWKFYQRWNNYWFSYTWTPSRSSTKVDVSSYWPNNYYSNSTFRRVSYSWNWRTDASTTAAFNLWWGVTGTAEAAQGPCPNWFHIPSRSDITNLVSMYIGLDILSDTDSQAYLKIPRMWIRDNYNATVNDAWTDWWFRSCTINTEPYESTYYPYACECWNQSQYQIQLSTWHMNSYCLGIRPFRNEAIMPDDTRVAILN